MKTITVKIDAPKCGASSDSLRELLAETLGANAEYVGARLTILPPDTKAAVSKIKKDIRKAVEDNTLLWIGGERVAEDNKVAMIEDTITEATEVGRRIIAEHAESLRVRLPELRAALGKGADLVELPDPDNFKLTVTMGVSEPTAITKKGLPRNATEANVAVAIQKGKGYDAVIDHLLALVDKVGTGKDGSAAALRIKEDAATAAKLGAVDKEQIHKLNQLTAKLLAAGKGGAKKAAAKAALVTAITDAAQTAEATEPTPDDGEAVSNAEVVSEAPQNIEDAAIALI
jgi:hypothetical protein